MKTTDVKEITGQMTIHAERLIASFGKNEKAASQWDMQVSLVGSRDGEKAVTVSFVKWDGDRIVDSKYYRIHRYGYPYVREAADEDLENVLKDIDTL